MIINAVCHRNYMDNSCVQVAVYDDRVEVSSPGMLYGGVTMEEIMSGRSSIRNRTIAEELGMSLATVKNDISILRKAGLIKHIGGSKKGQWKILQKRIVWMKI